MLLDKTLVDWRRELKRRKKREKVWRNEFVNLFFRENSRICMKVFFCEKCLKNCLRLILKRFPLLLFFFGIKRGYEMRVRWIYWRLIDVEGKNKLLKIEMKRKVNLFEFWKDFFFYENLFVEIDLNFKEKEFHWISKDSQLI